MFGLRVKPTYEQLIGEITKPLFNSYPDRKASQLRFSNWLSQLDAEGVKTLEQQQLQAMKEQQKQNLLREYSMSHGISRAEADAMSSATSDTFMDAQSRPDSDFRRRYGMPNNEEDQFIDEPQYFQMHGQGELSTPRSSSLLGNLIQPETWAPQAKQDLNTQQQIMDQATTPGYS